MWSELQLKSSNVTVLQNCYLFDLKGVDVF